MDVVCLTVLPQLAEDQPYLTMFRLSPTSSHQLDNVTRDSTWFSWIVVRHPWTRLAAAYRSDSVLPAMVTVFRCRDRVLGCRARAEWFTRLAATLGLTAGPTCLARQSLTNTDRETWKELFKTID